MATDLIPKQFKISETVWNQFVAACQRNGTFPSAVLRQMCDQYASNNSLESEMNELDVKQIDLEMSVERSTGYDDVIFRVGELYSGPGRVGMGAALAEVIDGGRRFSTIPVWTNDYDKDSCETWKKNVLGHYQQKKGFSGDCQVIHGDVRELDIENLPDIDGLMFGFPCNDFSIVGEHKGV